MTMGTLTCFYFHAEATLEASVSKTFSLFRVILSVLFFLFLFCFFFFLGAGTPSHPDSVGCVTDVIGLQCGQTSISITDHGGADYLERPTSDI